MTAFLFNSKREKQGGGMNRKAANKKQRVRRMFHGFEFAVMGKIDRSERSTRRSTYRKSWESRFDDAEFLRNSRGRKSRNSRGHPSLGPRLCNDYLVFTSLLDPADRIWRMDNLIPTSNDESTSLDCVDQKLDRIYPFSSFVFCFERK